VEGTTMIGYSIRIFSTRAKKKLIELLSLFTLQERALMSRCGVDPKTIYGNIRRYIKRYDGMGFLLFKENTLIGLGTIYKFNKSVATLGLLAIKPSEQRKGYGTFLIKYILEIAKLNGIKEIRGEIVTENDKAISFHKKFNFIFAGGEDAYLIRKHLVSSTDEIIST